MRTNKRFDKGDFGLDLKIFKANYGTTGETQITYKPNTVSPSFISERLEKSKGILFIDEFDSLQSATKEKIGEVIKLLSDSGSEFKLLVVGVGNSLSDLLQGNSSISRNIRQIKLNRMENHEIKDLIRDGFNKCKLIAGDDLISKIAEISAGYPHFAHLLALKSGENAIKNGSQLVTEQLLFDSIAASLEDAEEYLRSLWNSSMINLESQVYVQVLLACAAFTTQEFSAKELRKKLNDLFSLSFNQAALNQYLTKLVSDDEQHILHRISKGIYRFSDPRMPSFVKLQGINKKLIT